MDFGIKGLWFGPTVSVILMTVLYNMIIGCIDWQDLLYKMELRRQEENARIANLRSEERQVTTEEADDEERRQ